MRGVNLPIALAVVSRWNNLLEEIAEQLCSSKALLQLWQRYKDYSKECASTVQRREDRANELLKAATNKDVADDEAVAWIQDCNVCLGTLVFSTRRVLDISSLVGLLLIVCQLMVCLRMWEATQKLFLRIRDAPRC